MYGRAVGVSLLGIGGRPVTVEAFVGRGLPSFVVTGLLALVLPDSLQIPLLGVGFGGLHLGFGYLVRRAGHGSEG